MLAGLCASFSQLHASSELGELLVSVLKYILQQKEHLYNFITSKDHRGTVVHTEVQYKGAVFHAQSVNKVAVTSRANGAAVMQPLFAMQIDSFT